MNNRNKFTLAALALVAMLALLLSIKPGFAAEPWPGNAEFLPPYYTLNLDEPESTVEWFNRFMLPIRGVAAVPFDEAVKQFGSREKLDLLLNERGIEQCDAANRTPHGVVIAPDGSIIGRWCPGPSESVTDEIIVLILQTMRATEPDAIFSHRKGALVFFSLTGAVLRQTIFLPSA